MKRIHVALAAALMCLPAGCKDYLDVNTNPNAPQSVSANLYLPPMLAWMTAAPLYDGRYVGLYTQQWTSTSTLFAPSQTWQKMGYDLASDNGAEQWRDVYWSLGQNLVDMNTKAAAEQRWDLLGVGQVLKAWGWQALTDLHGEIIIKEALDPTRTSFDYDTQQYAYFEVDSLLNEAIKNLRRGDGAVDATYLARGDKIYNGDRTKWMKFAYGLLAINRSHFTNKAGYNPANVVALVDSAFTSNADDALLQYVGTSPDNADFNFWGPRRANVNLYRPTQFLVSIMNGTVFGGVVDPRMSRLISPAPDGVFRGLDVNAAQLTPYGALTTQQQPNNFFGYPSTTGVGLQSKYLFSDRSRMPIMTYAQLQFIKAEAAFRLGNKPTALTAYRNGISAHLDFVNSRNLDDNQSASQISAAEKAAFLGALAIVPTDPNALTLTQIMTQKYIAQWAWGHNELWMDMRRFHYTDIDPATGAQVYPGFTPPTTLYSDNSGKVVQRIRPRYNSEYVWNLPSLTAIGGDKLDFHTKPLWITQP